MNALLGQVRTAFPAAWQAHDASADLGVIRTQLDAVVSAAEGGDWAAAETARLDAYATLESGAEARIAVFAPDLKLRLENLFWNGQRPDGLARLIRERGHPPPSAKPGPRWRTACARPPGCWALRSLPPPWQRTRA